MRITEVRVDILDGQLEGQYWGRAAWGKDYESKALHGPTLDRDYPLRWRMRHYWADSVKTCLIRIRTDEGLIGLGEAKGVVAPEAAKSFIEDCLSPLLLGQDPLATRVLADRMQAAMRGRGHIQGFAQEAAAGIDIALWDIKGQVAGMPICDLLGGRYREWVRVYYSGVPGISSLESQSDRTRLEVRTNRAVELGFTGAKIAIGFGRSADLESVRIVRRTAGDDFLILVDALGSYDYTQALRLAYQLEELGVEWFEAPTPTEDVESYIELSKKSPIHIANDLIWTPSLTLELLRRGARIVVQPETIKVGITACARIAEIADAFGCAYAPHVSLGSAIQFASTTHVAASAPNFVISEYWGGESPLGNAILQQPLEFANSALRVPNGPGLGITLNEDAVARVAVK